MLCFCMQGSKRRRNEETLMESITIKLQSILITHGLIRKYRTKHIALCECFTLTGFPNIRNGNYNIMCVGLIVEHATNKVIVGINLLSKYGLPSIWIESSSKDGHRPCHDRQQLQQVSSLQQDATLCGQHSL